MTTSMPTPTSSGNGGCPVGPGQATCCLGRLGSHEVDDHYKRVFQKYGRSTSWFPSKAVATANLPKGVTWETYYYRDRYRFLLAYQTKAAASGTGFTGTIDVTLRAHATVHSTLPNLLSSAPGLFTTVTSQRITAAFTSWNNAVQKHWTNRNYIVELGAPDCPGTFAMKFALKQESNAVRAHVTFSVLEMQHPNTDKVWAAALGNPADPLYHTAQDLAKEWRSNAKKFNIGDSRGALVFAHEYGHWMGWGDEYIEESGTMPHPTAKGKTVAMETKSKTNHVSLRVAIRIKNPTRVYHSAHGTDQEDIDITPNAVRNGLMASMTTPLYPARYVYTIVHDFIRLYNKDHYGGGTTAYCNDVR
ncbi:hypothetical protein [Polyangium sp. y55x31]|uniref:hypothetical protein n=1 Tax=Polyangium sp. y55x31 TaxID=3042688 RepID=UPI00248268BF|nr:hypothetical protein [Polyangium sp. y55x31]MDI1475409.1 hypothetical protein [Polyangium sp. y55x31]